MYEIDGIVYAGEANKPITIKNVRIVDNYKLALKFSTGEQKIFDGTKLIEQGGVFEQLKDIKLFNQAYIDYGTVVWNEVLDVAPEYLYEESEPAN